MMGFVPQTVAAGLASHEGAVPPARGAWNARPLV